MKLNVAMKPDVNSSNLIYLFLRKVTGTYFNAEISVIST